MDNVLTGAWKESNSNSKLSSMTLQQWFNFTKDYKSVETLINKTM
jgi:hypothetical protein